MKTSDIIAAVGLLLAVGMPQNALAGFTAEITCQAPAGQECRIAVFTYDETTRTHKGTRNFTAKGGEKITLRGAAGEYMMYCSNVGYEMPSKGSCTERAPFNRGD